jgi:hypothetical protein
VDHILFASWLTVTPPCQRRSTSMFDPVSKNAWTFVNSDWFTWRSHMKGSTRTDSASFEIFQVPCRHGSVRKWIIRCHRIYQGLYPLSIFTPYQFQHLTGHRWLHCISFGALIMLIEVVLHSHCLLTCKAVFPAGWGLDPFNRNDGSNFTAMWVLTPGGESVT